MDYRVSRPWKSFEQWRTVHKLLFEPHSTLSDWKTAYWILIEWTNCSDCPAAIHVTASLLRALNAWRELSAATEADSTCFEKFFTTPHEIAVLLSEQAIIEFVNEFAKLEEHNVDFSSKDFSMRNLASLAGLPAETVPIRNKLVHFNSSNKYSKLDEGVLKRAYLYRYWSWVKKKYWDVELQSFEIAERLSSAMHQAAESKLFEQILTTDSTALLASSGTTLYLDFYERVKQSLTKATQWQIGSNFRHRVRHFVEKVTEHLMLDPELLAAHFVNNSRPPCRCGLLFDMTKVKSLLDLVALILTTSLEKLQKKTFHENSAVRTIRDMKVYRIAKMFCNSFTDGSVHSVANIVLSFLASRATDLSSLAGQWLCLLVRNCCRSLSKKKRKLCSHYSLFKNPASESVKQGSCSNTDETKSEESLLMAARKRVANDEDCSPLASHVREFNGCAWLRTPSVAWQPLLRKMIQSGHLWQRELALQIARRELEKTEVASLEECASVCDGSEETVAYGAQLPVNNSLSETISLEDVIKHAQIVNADANDSLEVSGEDLSDEEKPPCKRLKIS